MLIDHILSRFSISTKVMAFVLPFVLSITAVGLMGLYASGLLQQRMEISNGTMRSLNGFRNVNAAMTRFLDETSEETRGAVVGELSTQQATLNQNLSEIGADGMGQRKDRCPLAALPVRSGAGCLHPGTPERPDGAADPRRR